MATFMDQTLNIPLLICYVLWIVCACTVCWQGHNWQPSSKPLRTLLMAAIQPRSDHYQVGPGPRRS